MAGKGYFFYGVMTMTCKAAILIDGGFFHYAAKALCGEPPTNEHIIQFTKTCAPGCDIFRVFYYNSFPYGGDVKNPISKTIANHKDALFVKERLKQFEELAQKNLIAFRKGNLRFNGWKIRKKVAKALISGNRSLPLQEDDIEMDFQQKGVDIKIGLDVAWLSSRRIVEKMVIVTGDTDFVPALKHARREGVNVAVVEFSHTKLSPAIKEHSDECIQIDFDITSQRFIVNK